MKKRIIAVIAFCMAVFLFAGCGGADAGPTLETNPEPTSESAAPAQTTQPAAQTVEPSPEVTPEPGPEEPAELSKETIEAVVAGLFEKFADFNWEITIEDIMDERPDISKKVENLSTKAIGKIEYEITIGGKQFIEDYSTTGKSVDSFSFSAKTNGAGSLKSGDLSEDEVEQFKEAVFSRIKSLKGELRYLTEGDMGNYNKAVHNEIFGYVAKTKYGFVSIRPKDSYVDIQFYSSNYGSMKKTFTNARKM